MDTSKSYQTLESLKNSLLLECDRKFKAVRVRAYDRQYQEVISRLDYTLSLIKTLSDTFKNRLRDRILNNEPIKLKELISENRKRAKFIITDQVTKLIAIINNQEAIKNHAIGFIWKTREDLKVAGRITKADPNSKYHGDHWSRKDKFFYLNASDKDKFSSNAEYVGKLKDGIPGLPINCRCYAYYLYDIDKIPKEFLASGESGKVSREAEYQDNAYNAFVGKKYDSNLLKKYAKENIIKLPTDLHFTHYFTKKELLDSIANDRIKKNVFLKDTEKGSNKPYKINFILKKGINFNKIGIAKKDFSISLLGIGTKLKLINRINNVLTYEVESVKV